MEMVAADIDRPIYGLGRSLRRWGLDRPSEGQAENEEQEQDEEDQKEQFIHFLLLHRTFSWASLEI
jgi:hypothetical protein